MQLTFKTEQTGILKIGGICGEVHSFAYIASQYLYLQIGTTSKVKIFRTVIKNESCFCIIMDTKQAMILSKS